METKLTTTSCYNPFFIFGKEIKRIVFYGDGKEIASVNWFGSNNVYKSITLPFEVKRAMKVNLDRKDAFYVKSKEDYPLGPSYDLYIHEELVGLAFVETRSHEYWYNVQKEEIWSVKIHGVRENYRKDEHGKVVREYLESDYDEHFSCNYTFEETEEWRRCKELSERLNKLSVTKLNEIDVHYILEEYDITPKKQLQ